jgi:hypothetical protein
MPVAAKPWRLAMGLRPLDLSRWLEVDGHRSEELDLKGDLLAAAHAQVFAAHPGSEAASDELLGMIVANLDRYHPGLVTDVGGGRYREESTGRLAGGSGMHPLEVASRLVQEDLCIMIRSPSDWVLGAASVCFPSRWSLAQKMGRDLAAIHAPVPGYESSLASPTAAFFDRLQEDRPVWRLNWTLVTDPALHQPGGGRRRAPGQPPADPGRQVWFRVERQTLRRMRHSPAVCFTIRTYVTALEELVTTHPEAAPALRAALAEVPPDVDDYKGWGDLRPAIRDWLWRRGH